MSDTQTEADRPADAGPHPWGDQLPDVVDEDGGRWSREVVGSTTYRTEWRGYTIEARCQVFADDTFHIQVPAPPEPPSYAEELVVDLLDRGEADGAIGRALARGWRFDLATLAEREGR